MSRIGMLSRDRTSSGIAVHCWTRWPAASRHSGPRAIADTGTGAAAPAHRDRGTGPRVPGPPPRAEPTPARVAGKLARLKATAHHCKIRTYHEHAGLRARRTALSEA